MLQQLKQNAASSAFDGENDPPPPPPPMSEHWSIIGYWVELEEEAKGTTCVHTLNEASLNSEVHG